MRAVFYIQQNTDELWPLLCLWICIPLTVIPLPPEKSFPSTSHRAGLLITFSVTASLKIYLFCFYLILVLVIEFWFDRIFSRH